MSTRSTSPARRRAAKRRRALVRRDRTARTASRQRERSSIDGRQWRRLPGSFGKAPPAQLGGAASAIHGKVADGVLTFAPAPSGITGRVISIGRANGLVGTRWRCPGMSGPAMQRGRDHFGPVRQTIAGAGRPRQPDHDMSRRIGRAAPGWPRAECRRGRQPEEVANRIRFGPRPWRERVHRPERVPAGRDPGRAKSRTNAIRLRLAYPRRAPGGTSVATATRGETGPDEAARKRPAEKWSWGDVRSGVLNDRTQRI